MRIREVQLQNFKRFTDLTITDIPESAKLVLLIGSNGCGKSSVFDAFNWIVAPAQGYQNVHQDDDDPYFQKQPGRAPNVTITVNDSEIDRFSQAHAGLFYGRNSLRIPPRVKSPDITDDLEKAISINADASNYLIENDDRFFTDVHVHSDLLNQALQRLLVEGKLSDEETSKIRTKYIASINHALVNIFGNNEHKTLRFAIYKQPSPDKPVEPYFKKGDSEIPFEVLSHGEKQVIIILFNFLVRQEQLKGKVIFIDEMDVHMNTRLQFDLLKEIAENWIPESSQLWTASHALGFIDYARQSEHAAIIDFDDLDYDLPQVLTPEQSDSQDVLEIAIPKSMLGEIFREKKIVLCEGNDADYYNNAGLKKTLFVGKNYNKFRVFIGAQEPSPNLVGLIDRDYLTEDEIIEFEGQYPSIHILRLYSIENYLYHPENLAEAGGASFDKQHYINDLTEEKNRVKIDLIAGVRTARDTYPYRKEMDGKRLKDYVAAHREILTMLESDDFDTFYKVFPAKDYGKQLPQRANRNPLDLAKMQWFRGEIAKLLKVDT